MVYVAVYENEPYVRDIVIFRVPVASDEEVEDLIELELFDYEDMQSELVGVTLTLVGYPGTQQLDYPSVYRCPISEMPLIYRTNPTTGEHSKTKTGPVMIYRNNQLEIIPAFRLFFEKEPIDLKGISGSPIFWHRNSDGKWVVVGSLNHGTVEPTKDDPPIPPSMTAINTRRCISSYGKFIRIYDGVNVSSLDFIGL